MSTESDAALRHSMNQATNLAFTPNEVDAIVARLADQGYYVAPIHPAGTTPGARASDPVTSKRAANRILLRAGTQRTILLSSFLQAYLGNGPAGSTQGLTDEQAMEMAEGVSPLSEYAKRCSELREAGWIRVVPGVHRVGNSGQERIVSAITEAGRAAITQVPR